MLSRYLLEQACGQESIWCRYEELPAAVDPVEAMMEDAPILHPDVNSRVGLPEPL